MENLAKNLDFEKFTKNLFKELSKMPFGCIPKTELELIIFHSIIDSKGGYGSLNSQGPFIQKELKLSQNKFKNKVLEAQLRFDNDRIDVKKYFQKIFFKNKISELVTDDNYLTLTVSNPLLLNDIKVFFDSNEIINDYSFNKSILKIDKKGLLKILNNIIDEVQLKQIEKKFVEDLNLKEFKFSLINNLNFNTSFEASLDPFKSVSKLIDFIRNI